MYDHNRRCGFLSVILPAYFFVTHFVSMSPLNDLSGEFFSKEKKVYFALIAVRLVPFFF
ncbi:hypothetical protein LEP1GSC187_2758 [Leptospira santarosai str. ZUN179]|uniref:Uncharacterized protein n=1 Tax=Leptospira santarosai str. ZUN179 TaxID=1049985 RepID=M6USA3_9LEPT|nr:hypothetical protein LEP1GSC187_2758 [Leptospira santarosai str. ZUN179]